MRCDVRGRGRIWALGLLLWMLLTGSAVADGGPLRVVLRGYAHPATIQEYLELMSHICWTRKGLPAAPVPLLSAAQLQQAPHEQSEVLFDGERWAKYTINAVFVVDSNCQPIIWRSFHVDIIDGCRRALSGTKGPYMPGESDVPQVAVFENSVVCHGRPPKREVDLSGLPVDDAGLGVQCIWTEDIVSRELKTPLGKRSGNDHCLYARRSHVALPSGAKQVVVRMRLDNRNDRGGDVGAIFPMSAEMRLAEFSDGTPIPPTRFSRESVEAFLRQPHKQALGAGR
ncbi:hypothetical protein KAK06_15245 [Ideonella sp. 4Y11]|uniref:Uncharacterized protein n=1 Tax=Ideonella aquatica TaxID=2824119 RepID=A0A940YIW2_9BURK|nr:hypothetical protein [Ideonella aquatica]MBQ0960309.1 hypothetical protein [Ideonella aquatica]